MIKHLVIVGLIIGGSRAGRMVMSQEGYQDMDASGPRGFGGPSGGGGEFGSFDPSGAGSSMRGFPSSESSSEFGGPGGFEQSQGPRGGGSQGFGFNAPPPQNLDVMGGPGGQFGPSGASGGEDDQPSGFPSGSSRGPQMFDNFQGEGGPQGFGGPGFGGPQGGFGGPSSQGFAPSSQEEGPATLINHQSFGGGESLGHPAFGAQGGFQDAEGDDQFVKDQDSKLSAQLMRDDGDDGGQSGGQSNFGGGSNSFDGPNGMSFDDGTKFGPDGGFQMSGRQPRTSLGGAWVGGNMISPKGGPGGAFLGPQGLDGESQGVTRLDSATIGARSRQLGIRQPNPQQMNGPNGPRGPIASSFNKFRPMMMGFRPPRRGHGGHGQGPPPPRGPPMMGAMSEPDFQVFKPQHPLSSRPALNFIPMGGEGGFGGHRDMMADMARPHMMMASGPYGRAGPMMGGGQDISNINTFIGVSGGSVGGGGGGRGYYKK